MTRVVVVGDLMTDTVARAAYPLAKGSDTPAAVTSHGGGSGANVAAWLALEGAEVAFVGRRGSDIAGRNRDMELMGSGVDARLVMDSERPTGTCVVLVTHKGDRTMLSDPGANSALLPEDIERCKDLFTQGVHFHLSGYSLINEGSRKAAIHALDLARQAQMSVSVDGASSSPLKRMGAEPFLEWTQGARLLVVNAAEAEVLTGRDNPEAAAKVLTAWYPQVVIKNGAEGSLWYTNGRPDAVTVAADPVEKIVDGTGAGDAFIAGFLPPWLDGKPPAEALASGNRLAAQALQHLGARPSLDVLDNPIH
ncbi:sugar kinase [Actinomadura logoneensis]|uniref:Sugar kinase n=1 Tax=Actinomadura logoneensis TaxID=2293572 RepID=A0A372JSF6_9ACTN|nr:sugar kinase [Actinomadura logoneensis]RFU42947.1 sugar kinase [Actinomadura logoneensis]